MKSEIEHLYRIEKFMESMSDMDRLLEVIIREGRITTNAEFCSLALYDEDTDDLNFYAVGRRKREDESNLKCIPLEMESSIVKWAATEKKTVNISDVYNDQWFYRHTDKQIKCIIRSILAVPMIRRGKLIGVMYVVNKQNQDGFSEHDEKLLAVIAAQAALVIENARLHEENLQQAQLSALGRGIAGAAHYIKNLLNGIDSGGYILERGIRRGDIKNIKKGWNIMKRNIKLTENLALDMLNYSRLQKPEYKPTDINKICTEVAELMREKAKEKDVNISLDLQPDLGQVILDPKGIHRCILNLVSNAIDACDKSEGTVKITVSVPEEDNYFEISVSDNGCGISEEELKNIFKVFFSTKGSKGTGLGLAITQKIISEHGGDISVESELGVGTKFTITLPLYHPHDDKDVLFS